MEVVEAQMYGVAAERKLSWCLSVSLNYHEILQLSQGEDLDFVTGRL
jgi:hypothetical protein